MASFFCIFHALSFELNSFFDRRCPLTALSTRQGHWEFERMPFGIKGASHTFQRLMALMMKGLSFKEVLTYLDDVLVYLSTFHGHFAAFSRIFDSL